MKYSIAIHGGAGTILRSNMTPKKEIAYTAALQNALAAGSQILAKGGSALTAVQAAVVDMEDCPLFNAGCGSVFNKEGQHEMDAAIMCGKSLASGGVAAVQNVKNPIVLSRLIMEQSPHILLCGAGAKMFAQQQQLPLMSNDYFDTQQRLQQWQKIKHSSKIQLDHSDNAEEENKDDNKPESANENHKMGTVGAVACDVNGNIAAATSTGGMTNKLAGRVGDSPLIGIGNYANNATCAVSCTGKGEVFMQYLVAYDLACLMAYKGMSLQAACSYLVHQKLPQGTGGLIAVNAQGEIALPFNSKGMYRAWKVRQEDGIVAEGIGIFKED